MTLSDTKNVQILAGLFTIAGFTWFFAFRMRGVDTTQPVSKPKPNVERRFKDPTLLIGLIEKTGMDEGGRKNVFQYRQMALSQPSGPIRSNLVSTGSNTKAVIAEATAASELPPSKTFKYEGFSIRGTAANGRMLASLSDGGNTYTVALGECLMGQYCVRQLTENMIEIEDLQIKQRRAFLKTVQ